MAYNERGMALIAPAMGALKVAAMPAAAPHPTYVLMRRVETNDNQASRVV